MPFEIPSRIQSRLDRKASPAPRQAQPRAEAVNKPNESHVGSLTSEIIPIAEWAEYRVAHPELVFTGKFDLQGRPIWAAEERTK